VLFQNDEKGHAIIGEAAFSLALGEKEISIGSLFTQLGYMAKSDTDSVRLKHIFNAREWLKSFQSDEVTEKQVPYLQTLIGLNRDLN